MAVVGRVGGDCCKIAGKFLAAIPGVYLFYFLRVYLLVIRQVIAISPRLIITAGIKAAIQIRPVNNQCRKLTNVVQASVMV